MDPVTTQSAKPDCTYRAHDNVPPNPLRLILNYGSSWTYEGRLKAAVMRRDRHRLIGLVSPGMGGVGKTCAMRGLGNLHDVGQRFMGGLLYIQLGNLATLSTLITAIASLVQRTGNAHLGEKLRGLDSLQEVADAASVWFKDQTCLLLVDDIRMVNGIDASVLTVLATMMSEDSCLVYTTRTDTFTDVGGLVIEFRASTPYSYIARQMLLRHAGFDGKDTLSESNEDAVRSLLEVCKGLPLTIGVVGDTVRKLGKRQWRDATLAWGLVHDLIRSGKENLVAHDDDIYDYGTLRLIVDTSLDILQDRYENMSFDYMFRALSVLKKQQTVSMDKLRKLWGLPNLDKTETVVREFAEVNLVLAEVYQHQKLVQLHEVILDIATRKASEKNELERFWQSFIHDRVLSAPQMEQTRTDQDESSTRVQGRFIRWCQKMCCCNMSEGVVGNTEH